MAAEDHELVECDLRCTCGVVTSWRLDGDASVREVLADVTCPACDRRGACVLAKPGEGRTDP